MKKSICLMCALLNFKNDTVIHAKQTRRFLCILWINYNRHLLTMPANPNPISSRALTICKPANVGKFWTYGILYIMALIVSISTVWTSLISFLGNRGFVHQHNLRFNCNTRNVLRKYKRLEQDESDLGKHDSKLKVILIDYMHS